MTTKAPDRLHNTAIPLELLRHPYTSEPAFVGADTVPAWRPLIAPIGDMPPLDQEHEQFLVHLTQGVNETLAREAHNLVNKGDSNNFMTLEVNASEAEDALIHTAYAASELVSTFRKLHLPTLPIVCPPAGSTPLARLIAYFGVSKNSIYSPEIKGTVADKTGFAHLDRASLPLILRDPHTMSLLVEDIEDTGITALSLARARNEERMERSENPHDSGWWDTLALQLREAAHNPVLDHRKTHTSFVTVLEDERILFLPAFTKGRGLTEALIRAALQHATIWSGAQRRILDHHIPFQLPPKWVVGGHTMDYGLPLTDFVPIELQNDPFFRTMILDENNQWLIRLGADLPFIAYLEQEKGHKDTIKSLAREILMRQFD